jgi:hypothetical protein
MAQIPKKLLEDNAVNQDKFRADNDQYITGRNAGDTADVNMLKVRSDDELELGALTRQGTAPTDPAHLANKAYVDDVIAGIRDPKDAVRVASTANVDEATGGLLTIDGITLVAGDRVLLKDQTAGSENGIWVAASGAWSRATDADEDDEVTQGLSVDVVEGTVNGQTRWLLTTADPITVDTTALTFVKVPTGASSVAWGLEDFTLIAGDITNQYVDLGQDAEAASVRLTFHGVEQDQGTDYTLSGSPTRVTFAGDLATGGNAALIAGDKIVVAYSYFP